MRRLLRGLIRFAHSEAGPTAVEYAVMLALILLVCLAAIRTFGLSTQTLYQNIVNSVSS